MNSKSFINPDITFSSMQLEYKISIEHIGEGKIAPGFPIQYENPYWSYATNRGAGVLKKSARTRVASRLWLLDNLRATPDGQEMDITPLLDDQRAAGFIFGDNPLRNMVTILQELSAR